MIASLSNIKEPSRDCSASTLCGGTRRRSEEDDFFAIRNQPLESLYLSSIRLKIQWRKLTKNELLCYKNHISHLKIGVRVIAEVFVTYGPMGSALVLDREGKFWFVTTSFRYHQQVGSAFGATFQIYKGFEAREEIIDDEPPFEGVWWNLCVHTNRVCATKILLKILVGFDNPWLVQKASELIDSEYDNWNNFKTVKLAVIDYLRERQPQRISMLWRELPSRLFLNTSGYRILESAVIAYRPSMLAM